MSNIYHYISSTSRSIPVVFFYLLFDFSLFNKYMLDAGFAL